MVLSVCGGSGDTCDRVRCLLVVVFVVVLGVVLVVLVVVVTVVVLVAVIVVVGVCVCGCVRVGFCCGEGGVGNSFVSSCGF